MPTPIWKDKAEEVNLQADTEADSLLDKLKASKWTAAVMLGVAVVVIMLLVRMF